MVTTKFSGIIIKPRRFHWIQVRSSMLCVPKVSRLPIRSWDSRTCSMGSPRNNGCLFHSGDYPVLNSCSSSSQKLVFDNRCKRLTAKFLELSGFQARPYKRCAVCFDVVKNGVLVNLDANCDFDLNWRWEISSRPVCGCRGNFGKRRSAQHLSGKHLSRFLGETPMVELDWYKSFCSLPERLPPTVICFYVIATLTCRFAWRNRWNASGQRVNADLNDLYMRETKTLARQLQK